MDLNTLGAAALGPGPRRMRVDVSRSVKSEDSIFTPCCCDFLLIVYNKST